MLINIVPHCLHKGDHGAIAGKIRNLGVQVSDEQFDEILARLRVIMEAKERPLATEDELEAVIRDVTAG
jgi:isopropylmalate/homocitrate/citramalate synthase